MTEMRSSRGSSLRASSAPRSTRTVPRRSLLDRLDIVLGGGRLDERRGPFAELRPVLAGNAEQLRDDDDREGVREVVDEVHLAARDGVLKQVGGNGLEAVGPAGERPRAEPLFDDAAESPVSLPVGQQHRLHHRALLVRERQVDAAR